MTGLLSDIDFIALWRSGAPVHEIARAEQRHYSAVSRRAAALGLPPRVKRRRPQTPEIAIAPHAMDGMIRQLREPRADGECDGLLTVAAKTGLSVRDVYHATERLGCGVRHRLNEHGLRLLHNFLMETKQR